MKIRAALMGGICASAIAFPAYAQDTDEDEITADEDVIIVTSVTDEQAKVFWPLYRQYREEMQTVGDRLVNLIENYGQNYESLTDEQAAQMMKEYLKMQKDSNAIKEKYMPRFNKILPAKTVMRFYQIENKMDTIVMLAVASQIPLAK